MSALSVIQQAAGELGIAVPANVAGSADIQVSQLLALLNAAGRALSRRHDWQALTREVTFNTTAADDQGAVETLLGADNHYRHILNDVMWNRTRNERVWGPRAAQAWQTMKASGITGPFPEYRIRGGRLFMLPAPAAGETIALEYITRAWATSEDGLTYKVAVNQDNDQLLLDEDLLVLDLKWRWLKAKGMEYAEEFIEAEAAIVDAMARDGTAASVRLAGCTSGPGVRVSEGSWPI